MRRCPQHGESAIIANHLPTSIASDNGRSLRRNQSASKQPTMKPQRQRPQRDDEIPVVAGESEGEG